MFKKLLTYFLLFNFLNTLCFPEFEGWKGEAGSGFLITEAATDEIDSVVELVAEVCLELGDDFSDSDLEDQPDELKNTGFLKDFLLPPSLVFLPPVLFYTPLAPGYSCRFPVNFFEIDSPPPKLGLV